jgi:single-strand DNA-binding protein
MNTCTFCGRVVADAELKYIPSGTAVLKFRIASDVGFGEKKQTFWLGCAIWGKRGEALAQHITKGSAVTVVGELEPPRTYEAQGETRIAQDMRVAEIALQGGRDAGQGAGQAQGQKAPKNDWQAPTAGAGGTTGAGGGDFSDDLPFLPHERGQIA